MNEVSDYEARFKAAVEEHALRTGGLMVGDTFVLDDVTFRIAESGADGLTFERFYGPRPGVEGKRDE